jgi:hypothetical protein
MSQIWAWHQDMTLTLVNLFHLQAVQKYIQQMV